MTVFELQTSGIGSNRSTNGATTTSQIVDTNSSHKSNCHITTNLLHLILYLDETSQ